MKKVFLLLLALLTVLAVYPTDPPGTKVPLRFVVGSGKTKTVVDTTEIKRIKEIDEKAATADIFKPISFDTVLVTAKATAPTKATGTNTTDVANTIFVNEAIKNTWSRFDLLKKAGSDIKAIVLPCDFVNASAAAMNDGSSIDMLVYIPDTCTVTGVRFVQYTAGNYTPDNYNGIALYSLSGGTRTLVASSTNDTADPNLWEATANTVVTKAFSDTYNALPGFYKVVFFYNCSGTANTTPALHGLSTSSPMQYATTFTGITYYLAAQRAQATPPSTDTESNYVRSGVAFNVVLY